MATIITHHAGRSWVLVTARGTWAADASSDDMFTAQREQTRVGTPLFYYRLGSHAWVTTDAATITQIEAALAPWLAAIAVDERLAQHQTGLAHEQAEASAAMGIEASSGGHALAEALARITALAAMQSDVARQQGEHAGVSARERAKADTAIDRLMESAIVNDDAEALGGD